MVEEQRIAEEKRLAEERRLEDEILFAQDEQAAKTRK